MTKVLSIGDLHLFAKRSFGDREWENLYARLRKSDTPRRCVLLGDIFDFSWALHDSQDRVILQARDMISKIVQTFPDIQFDYVLGNHDSHSEFLPLLDELGNIFPNLEIHKAHIRIGDVLFMHGDATDKACLTPDGLMDHRKRWADRGPHSKWSERFYDVAVLLRIDELGGLIKFFPPIVKARLQRYVANCEISGVRHIVFGHTHRRLDSQKCGVYLISNSGAPIGRRKFMTIEIRALDVNSQ